MLNEGNKHTIVYCVNFCHSILLRVRNIISYGSGSATEKSYGS